VKLRKQERETARDYVDRESHYLWGKRYLLKICEHDAAPAVELKHRQMILRLRPGTDKGKRRALVDRWYREEIKKAVPPLLAHWQPLLGVRAERFFVRRMRTLWGSCRPRRPMEPALGKFLPPVPRSRARHRGNPIHRGNGFSFSHPHDASENQQGVSPIRCQPSWFLPKKPDIGFW